MTSVEAVDVNTFVIDPRGVANALFQAAARRETRICVRFSLAGNFLRVTSFAERRLPPCHLSFLRVRVQSFFTAAELGRRISLVSSNGRFSQTSTDFATSASVRNDLCFGRPELPAQRGKSAPVSSSSWRRFHHKETVIQFNSRSRDSLRRLTLPSASSCFCPSRMMRRRSLGSSFLNIKLTRRVCSYFQILKTHFQK